VGIKRIIISLILKKKKKKRKKNLKYQYTELLNKMLFKYSILNKIKIKINFIKFYFIDIYSYKYIYK